MLCTLTSFLRSIQKSSLVPKTTGCSKECSEINDLEESELGILQPDKNDSHESEISSVQLADNIKHFNNSLSFERIKPDQVSSNHFKKQDIARR